VNRLRARRIVAAEEVVPRRVLKPFRQRTTTASSMTEDDALAGKAYMLPGPGVVEDDAEEGKPCLMRSPKVKEGQDEGLTVPDAVSPGASPFWIHVESDSASA